MSVLNWSGVLSPSAAWHVPEEPAENLVLDVRDLRMRYGRTDVLSGVSFGARRGEVLALLGPNGAGKTTTIEILEGFRMRSSGQVTVLGTDPARGGEAWRARVGVVLQSWRDHGNRRGFHDLVHRLADREDATILLTTHDLDEAEKLADRILILAGGRIIADGSADELSRRMSTQAEVRWSRDGQRFVHSADEPTKFVRDLFRQYGESVEDLEVRRASLEDTYMAMVRQAETESGRADGTGLRGLSAVSG